MSLVGRAVVWQACAGRANGKEADEAQDWDRVFVGGRFVAEALGSWASGTFVLLCAGDKRAVGRLWPSSQTGDSAEVGLSGQLRYNLGVRLGDEVRLQLLHPGQLAAVQSCVLVQRLSTTAATRSLASSLVRDGSSLVQVYLSSRLRHRCVFESNEFSARVAGSTLRFVVKQLVAAEASQPVAYLVTDETQFHVESNDGDGAQSSNSGASDDSAGDLIAARIGGQQHEVEAIRNTLVSSLFSADSYRAYGLDAPRGVLVYGPAGTGKTHVVRTLAEWLGRQPERRVHFRGVSAAELVAQYYGDSEARLRGLFSEACSAAPSILFIDEIDAICAQRDGHTASDLDRRLVATLVQLFASIAGRRVVVVGATNNVGAVDSSLRQAGRLEVEVEIGIPSKADRLAILAVCARRVCPGGSVTAEQLQSLAAVTHGYVAADLLSLCQHAVLNARLRCAPPDWTDFQRALTDVGPSALREVAIDVPRVLWSDIGGNEHIKQQLQESVNWPLQHPDAFQRMGVKPPKGILLYGPPGCSKTLMAKALATEASLNFLAVKGPELYSKWVGESERAVREVFRKARASAPSIIFFDEIDALASKRSSGSDGGSGVADRVLAQLLSEMDGIEPLANVTVVAATNRPDMLDEALLRPGRFDRKIYVGPPDTPSRHKIFSILLRPLPCNPDEPPIDVQRLADLTEGFSGAEVAACCREACLLAIREGQHDAKWVSARHFEQAINATRPGITPDMLAYYASLSTTVD